MFSNLRHALILLTAILINANFVAKVQAQDGQILGGLLRELIKSELERRQQTQFQPGPPRLPPSSPQRPSGFQQKVRAARGHCEAFANESTTLLRAMERDAGRYAGLHNHLDEVRKLQVLASYVSQNLSDTQRSQVVLNELSQLDSQWRLAKYHLEQVPKLPGSCSRSIERLDRLSQQICSPFEIDPQFNRRELVRLFESLAAQIHHLERDVRYEAHSNPQARQLALQLQNLETRSRLLSDAIYGGEPYSQVVAEYNAMTEAWQPIAQQLYAINDVHIDRTFEQIREIDRGIREQLWLPQVLDTARIAHIAAVTGEEVKSLMSLVNLPMMLRVKDSQGLMRNARTLDSAMEEFCACAVDGASHQELISHWEKLDAAWRAFDRFILPLKSQRLQGSRQGVLAHMGELRGALGIQLVFDRHQVARYAAEIDGIADQLVFHVGQWQRRPSPGVPNNLVRMTNDFAASCHRFHDQCANPQSQQRQLYDQCNGLVTSWEKLRSQLIRCNTVDKSAIVRVADKSTNCLLHLQTLLQL